MKLWLWADDIKNPNPLDEHWVIVRDYAAAIELLENGVSFKRMYLDHDMGQYKKTGVDFLKWCISNKRKFPEEGIIIISMNPVGAQNMQNLIATWEGM